MASGKGGRKQLVKGLVVVVVVIIATMFGVNIDNWFPNEYDQNQPQEVVAQQTDSIQTEVDGKLTLTMIDVGQADSFFFLQEDTTALVDCGTRSTGDDVVEYLKSIGITKIDYVFGTHPHDDHMGGMYDVITNFEIGKIIIPEVEAGRITTNWYMKLMEEISRGGYEIEYAKLGAIYELGDAKIKIVGPISEPKDNVNNYSTVMKITFGQMDIIMTGDAEKDVEAEILATGENLEAEILKLGHHGSDTSTSDEFLEVVNPEYALISAKVGNKYNHPIKSTMDKLKNKGIEVYRTDENGTVVVTITANSASFSTEPGNYLSGVELEEKVGK